MRQDPEARNCFFVANGETLTVTFEASKVPETPIGDRERVHAAENGNLLDKKANSTGRTVDCKLVASQKPGKSHFLIFECVFFTKLDPATAKYFVTVSSKLGNQNSGPFKAGAASQLMPSGELWFTVE